MSSPIVSTDYKASTTQGKQRIYAGKFSNPMGGIPSVYFDEEFITYDTVTDKVYTNQAGNCSAALSNASRELVLRNPVDDTVISIESFITKLTSQGKFTDEDFFIAFYSLGRRAQLARDTFIVAQRAQIEAQSAYDVDPSEVNLAALNSAIAATEAARGEM